MRARLVVGMATLFASVAAFGAFDNAERMAVRKATSAAEAQIKAATVLDGKALTLLPVKGDSDSYCERMLINSFVNAGKTCVISNDEKQDERFQRILKEIKWDERQTTLKSIDPATADELGHLKSTQILVECRLDIVKRGRKNRPFAELNILAYAVSTKQYVWSANIAVDDTGRTWPEVSDITINVELNGTDESYDFGALLGTEMRDHVARYGYRVNASEQSHLLLSASIVREQFDKSGEYYIFQGTAQVRLSSKIGDGVLYEKTFSAKGRRGLGELEADKNLVAALSTQVVSWLDTVLEPRAFLAKHPSFADAVCE